MKDDRGGGGGISGRRKRRRGSVFALKNLLVLLALLICLGTMGFLYSRVMPKLP